MDGETPLTYDQWLQALRLRGFDAVSDPSAFRAGYDSGATPDDFANHLTCQGGAQTSGADTNSSWIVGALLGMAVFVFLAYCLSTRTYISSETFQALAILFTFGGSIYGISLLKAKGRDVSYLWLLILAFAPLWIVLALVWPASAESRWDRGLAAREPFNRNGAIFLALVTLASFVAFLATPIVAMPPVIRQ